MTCYSMHCQSSVKTNNLCPSSSLWYESCSTR